MFLRRFFDVKLAQTSYLIGCVETGEALVIDPNRDVEQYVQAAAAEKAKITHVTETHIHADFVSGTRELAARTGARIYLSNEGDADWKYAYAQEARAVLLKGGDQFMVGNIRIQVEHTPGHTPEHLTFLVTDTKGANAPIGAATGDFVFVGDVGRPDLLEKVAHGAGTMDRSARTLYRSLQSFARQPDWLQIWPGHGAGSSCGKGISAIPQSTLGYEKRFNWAFQVDKEDDFVKTVLSGQPDPPTYFAEMKRINKMGPAVLGGFARPPKLPPSALADSLRAGAVVVDTRPQAAFAVGHVPGTISIPFNASFLTWAGWLVPFTGDFYVIMDEHTARGEGIIDALARDLAMIGLERIAGYFDSGVLAEWQSSHGALATVPQIGPADLAESLRHGAVTLLDVRSDLEWESGHIEGARHIPLGRLPSRLAEIPRDKPIVLQCEAGARSAIGASILQAHGFDRVINLAGGYSAWINERALVQRSHQS